MRSKNIYILVFIVLFAIGCTSKEKAPNVSHINVNPQIIEFYKAFDALDSIKAKEQVQQFIEIYPGFTEAYLYKILKVGSIDSEEFTSRVMSFVNYDANKDIIDTAQYIFPDFNNFKDELTQAFKYYQYYLPQNKVPDIYLMVSGFTQSIAVDSAWIGLSIEKYLGAECIFYEWLEIPKYLRKGMIKEKMAPDVIRAMALTQFTERSANEDLINSMVYEGKIKYFVKKMFPELQDSLLFDYSKEQLRWAKKNEADTWAAIVEWKHLFSDDRMQIQKYTGDSPFTSFFGNESAPRMGEFLGYQIVRSYMIANPNITLEQLMKDDDGRKILAASNYRP